MKLTPEIMDEAFGIIECPFPLRNELRFKSQNIYTVRYGIETAAFVGSASIKLITYLLLISICS